jgi:hypothetical protein
MYLMPAAVGDLSYANCLGNDILNCLCFMKKACIKGMIMKLNI